MSEQPEALRLADALDELDAQFTHPGLCGEAAAELRRLHNVVERLLRERRINLDGGIRDTERIANLEALNAELLEALKELLQDTQHVNHNCGDEAWCPVIKARAAIAKGEQS